MAKATIIVNRKVVAANNIKGGKMNSELLLKIADQIEQESETFNQDEWGYSVLDDGAVLYDQSGCRTPCCIAGHALRLSGRALKSGEYISEVADELLGLSRNHLLFSSTWPCQAYPEGFLPEGCGEHAWLRPTPEMAATVLRQIVAGDEKVKEALRIG